MEKRLKHFKGKTIWLPGSRMGLTTREGPKAYREAIKFLKNMKPRAPLKWSPALYLAARAHCLDLKKHGSTGHTGNDGSRPNERIRRCGKTRRTGENLAYGSKAGKAIIAQLFIDDGVPSRGHRKNIISEKFKATGVAICSHPSQYRTAAVINYSSNIENNDETKKLLKSQKLPKAGASAGKRSRGKKNGSGKRRRRPRLGRRTRRRIRGCAWRRRQRAKKREAARRKYDALSDADKAKADYKKLQRADRRARMR